MSDPFAPDPLAIDPDEVFLVVGGRRLSGWVDVRITRGIERCPNSFELLLTDPDPRDLVEAAPMVVQPGDSCEVRAGQDLLITGYVDRVLPQFSSAGHAVRVAGRGKCQDLIDCAAIYPSRQISGATVFELAAQLAAPYGIGVQAKGDMGEPFPIYNIPFGATAWSVIEEACRITKVLCFESPEGFLQLLNAGSAAIPLTAATDLFDNAGSGFEEGVNLLEAQALYAADQRYSEYVVYRQSFDVLRDISDPNLIATFPDAGATRFRRLEVISEVNAPNGLANALERGRWECSRRLAQAQTIQLVTDAWRDATGALYAPGTKVRVHAPSLYVLDDGAPGTGAPWLISEVVYRKDVEQGTIAEITLAPPGAFAPPPTIPAVVVPPEIANLPGGLGAP